MSYLHDLLQDLRTNSCLQNLQVWTGSWHAPLIKYRIDLDLFAKTVDPVASQLTRLELVVRAPRHVFFNRTSSYEGSLREQMVGLERGVLAGMEGGELRMRMAKDKDHKRWMSVWVLSWTQG
jgi:hypothetical protein